MVRLWVPHTSQLYTPGDIPGTHFCYRLSLPQSNSAAGRIKSMKNPNDPTGNWTHDLLVCSAVPQPTASTRGPKPRGASYNFSDWMCWYCCDWNGITRHGALRAAWIWHLVAETLLSAIIYLIFLKMIMEQTDMLCQSVSFFTKTTVWKILNGKYTVIKGIQFSSPADNM